MFRIFSQDVSGKSLLLISIEACLIATSLLCAVKLRFWNNPDEFATYVAFPDFAVQAAIVVAVCLTCFYCNNLYDLTNRSNPLDDVLRIEQSLGAASLLLGMMYFLLPGLLPSRGVFIIAMLLAAALVMLSRKLLDAAWLLTAPQQRVLILGTGPLALQSAREFARRPDLNWKLEGFVATSRLQCSDEEVADFPVLGSVDQMETITQQRGISRIVVALEDRRGTLPTRELVTLRIRGVRVEEAATAISALTGRIALRDVKPSWFVFSEGFHRSRWNDLLKRVLDLAGGILGFLISSPLMVLVAAAIRLDSEGPIVYRQVRVGNKGKLFEVLKFRSMRVNAEAGTGAQWAQANDPRITRIGRFIRKYRLDELPQFLNVIRGDMSFVGPRPERPEFVQELRKSITYYDERHSVRPGITGWAQVQYSYGSSVEDALHKLEFDLFYLKNMSFTFDLMIIFQTIRIVVRGHGGR